MANTTMSSVYAADVVVPVATAPGSRSGVSWGAVIAGAFAAGAITLVLLFLGSGIGLATVSPWANDGVSAASFGIGAAIWLIVVHFIASGVGGYVAGRLRTKWVAIHSHEVSFRDNVHGFLAWAVATVFTAAVLATAVSSIAASGTQATATVMAGVAQGAAQGAAQNTPQALNMIDPMAPFIDKLYRAGPGAAPATTGEATAGTGQAALPDVRAESSRLLTTAVTGELPAADRTYLAQLISTRTGLSQAEAEGRIDEVVTEAKAAEVKAKEAVDEARKGAVALSITAAIAMLIGAAVASAMGAWGGRIRDRNEIPAAEA